MEDNNHMKLYELPKIEYGKTPNILLLGNGINNCFGCTSWCKMIEKIGGSEYDKYFEKIKNMPYPMQVIVATNDGVDRAIDLMSEELLHSQPSDAHKNLLDKYIDIPFDAVLTTNYTYEIEKTIDADFECKIKCVSKYRKTTFEGNDAQKQFGLFKFMNEKYKDSMRNIWHIHGEAARPSSMVLGHYYYGNLLSEIHSYVPKCISRYRGCQQHKTAFRPLSWIDYFLLGNVYIVGFGMNLSEMDIWWLINQKKRNFSDCGKIYFYEPNLDGEGKFDIKMLAEAYGVEVHTKPVMKDSDYLPYYAELPGIIGGAMR
jgi:hypothetical protein